MPTIKYTRSAATVSWIDKGADIPIKSIKDNSPGPKFSRSFLTRKKGFRFINFIEVTAVYDMDQDKFTRLRYTNASKIYTSPSFLGFESFKFTQEHFCDKKTELGKAVFRQTVGARTETAEKIGSGVGGSIGAEVGKKIVGPLGIGIGGLTGDATGCLAARYITSFPPIWSEIQIKISPSGFTDFSVLRYSFFPSMNFYTRKTIVSASKNESGDYMQTSFNGINSYNGNPNLKRWQKSGWGQMSKFTKGSTDGNPWGFGKNDACIPLVIESQADHVFRGCML